MVIIRDHSVFLVTKYMSRNTSTPRTVLRDIKSGADVAVQLSDSSRCAAGFYITPVRHATYTQLLPPHNVVRGEQQSEERPRGTLQR
jgi:hypothetical protein